MADAAAPGTGAEDVYLSASVARGSHTADSVLLSVAGTPLRLLAFAAHRRIALCYGIAEDSLATHAFLPALPSAITALKFAHAPGTLPLLAAATQDGSLRIWSVTADADSPQSSHQQSLHASLPAIARSLRWTELACSAPAAPTRALAVLRPDSAASLARAVFVSAHADGKICVWSLKDGVLQQLQQLSMEDASGRGKAMPLPMDAALALSGSNLFLAVAGTDAKITLFGSSAEKLEFSSLCGLSGHTDWVRSLDFATPEQSSSALLLASSAQDGAIRLWRLAQSQAESGSEESEADTFDAMAHRLEGGTRDRPQDLVTAAQRFALGEQQWSVRSDALLAGHDNWVTGVRWAARSADGHQPAALLSASADNSVILWGPESALGAEPGASLPSFGAHAAGASASHDTWMPLQRFGDLGNQGSVALGFMGALWWPSTSGDCGRAVLAHGWNGALHLWTVDKEQSAAAWKARPCGTGHFEGVRSARWEPQGRYFATGSSDRTTRIHAPCQQILDGRAVRSWHEIARPQTHGHAIQSLAWLDPLSLASAADEKVIRIFDAPSGFISSVLALGVLPGAAAKELPSTPKAALLAFHLPDEAHLNNPQRLAAAIRKAAAAAATASSKAARKLTIVAVSPLFDGLAKGQPLALSFADAERFLKWCYAEAWSTAVEHQRLDLSVQVLLAGSANASQWLARHVTAAPPARFYTVDDSSAALPFAAELDHLLANIETQALAPSDAASSSTPASSLDRASFPQHRVVALGGTFDHLHVGHKILLSMAALLATERIIVGVTDDSMLAKKKHAEMLEPLTERLAAVDAFLTAFRSTMTPLVQDVVQLSDVCGPAGTDADVQGLLVTDETLAGADMIAKVRSENGLGELRRHVIGVIGAEGETSMQGDAAQLAAAKVGSTAIRGWLAKRQADSPSSGASAHAQQEEFLRLAGRNGSRPVGASVPPLGLSNRALHSADEDIVEPPSASGQALGTAQRSVAGTLTRPPTEEELHSTTLWPELHKIYGHNLELLALDATDEGNLIASSCQAKTEENAVVYLHRTREEGGWKEEARLEGHTLGVTAVRFSPDGNALLTASRDRTWRLYELSEGRWQYKAHERAHKRLLNDVAWLSDGSGFVTASRDKTAILYLRDNGIEGEGFKERTRFSLPQGGGCTAVSTAHDHRTALGCENGDVHIFAPPRAGDWHEAGEPTTLLLQAHHTEAVHELAWQPLQRSAHADEEQEPLLLSVGADAAIRLTRICL